MDMTGCCAEIHMRTDANNLVTTASTTHLPDQKETVHMIQNLRQEACSGNMHDLAHVVSHDQMADCLTKTSADHKYLAKAVETGILPNTDKHPPFRELMKKHHKAYLVEWMIKNLTEAKDAVYLGAKINKAAEPREEVNNRVQMTTGTLKKLENF